MLNAWPRLVRAVLLALVPFVAQANDGLGVLRNRSCLLGVNSTPFAERRDATQMGIKVPIGVGIYQWSAGRVEAYILRIIIEEKLGYNVVFSQAFPSSTHGYYAAAGCQDPNSFAGCSNPTPQRTHFVMGAWWSYSQSAMRNVHDNFPDQQAHVLGDMGYQGREAFFIREDSYEPARTQAHLPLEYYYSYSHPTVDVSQFFNSSWMNIDGGDLLPCNESTLYDHRELADYIKYSGDNAGAEGSGLTLRAKCSYGHWWMSPSCRADPPRCVPHFTGGNGWRIDAMMQRAAIFNMPVAVATARSLRDTVFATRCTFYSFWPDTTFLTLLPAEIQFPPHDEVQWSQHDMRTRAKDQRVYKMAYYDLGHVENDGFDMARKVAANLWLTNEDMQSLIIAHLNLGETLEGAETVACEWLNANTDRWLNQWIPSASNCEEGKGMVDKDDVFTETRVGATRCDFCTPGYHSVRYADTKGETFICKKCPRGHMQGEMGKTVCDPCPIGEAADQEGQPVCTRCSSGRFSGAKGLAECTACSPGLVTMYPGATDQSKCICPEGKYWDPAMQGCKTCPGGMVCHVGSDARGLEPHNDASFAIVPLLTASHWSSAEDPFNVFKCQEAVRCLGGARPGQACSSMLVGQGCSACEEGHRWNGHHCLKCPPNSMSTFIFPCIPFFVTMCIIAFLYRISGDPYVKWNSWQNGIAVVAFILLNHYQIVNITRGADMAFPDDIGQVFSFFSLISSDQLTIFHPECVGLTGARSTLMMRALVPVFLFMLYVLVWCIARLISMSCKPAVKMDKDRTLNGFLSLIYTFFTGIVTIAFSIFKCGPNPNDKYSLLMDRSITCFEGEWNGMLAIGIIAVLLWCCGFGLLFLWRVLTIANVFHEPQEQRRWKFLFIRYRPDVHWWALVVVAKGILLNMGFIIIDSPVGQLFWACSGLFIYMVLLFWFMPLRHRILNSIDMWAHIALLLSTASLQRFVRAENSDIANGDVMMSKLIIAVVVSVIPFSAPVVLHLIYSQLSPSQRKEREARCEVILLSFASLEFVDKKEWDKFASRVGDWDFHFLDMACRVLDMEINKNRTRRGYSTQKLEGNLGKNKDQLTNLKTKMQRQSSRLSSSSRGSFDSTNMSRGADIAYGNIVI